MIGTGAHAYALIAEMAHDFRSPLSCVLLLTESLLDERAGPLTDLQTQYLRLVYDAALSLSSTTTDMMTLARQGHPVPKETPEAFVVADVLQATGHQTAPIILERGLALYIDAPCTSERLGYPRTLVSVLLALTLRAIRATAAGTVTLTAREGSDDRVFFTIRNTEPLLSPDAIPALFEPFTSDTAEKPHDFSASGFGTFIARQVLGELGSTLDVTSDAETGTCFAFTLALPRACPRSG